MSVIMLKLSAWCGLKEKLSVVMEWVKGNIVFSYIVC